MHGMCSSTFNPLFTVYISLNNFSVGIQAAKLIRARKRAGKSFRVQFVQKSQDYQRLNNEQHP
jgi:hypothetical protein